MKSKVKTYNRRYYLHRKVRQYGAKVESRERMIYKPAVNYDKVDKYIKYLVDEYNYYVQLELF